MKSKTGMSALVGIVLGVLVIIIILTSTFGPGSITKQLNRLFFGEEPELIRFDDEVVPGTLVGQGIPQLTFSGNEEEIAQQLAAELTSCWKRMAAAETLVRCSQVCFCNEEPCQCRTITHPEVFHPSSLIELGKIYYYIRTGKEPNAQFIADNLISSWKFTFPRNAQTNILSSGKPDEIYTRAGVFLNVNYIICASTVPELGAWLFINDDLQFNCYEKV